MFSRSELLTYLNEEISGIARIDGFRVDLGGTLSLFRHENPGELSPCIYETSMAFIVSGKKQVLHNDRIYEYGPGSLLLTSLDVPVLSKITEASPAAPYFGILLNLDRRALFEANRLLRDTGPNDHQAYQPLSVCDASMELLDAIRRLIRLTTEPGLFPVLEPLIVQEILIRLLSGPLGNGIRLAYMKNSSVGKISKAVYWLKDNVSESLDINALADMVHMSPSTFRQYFRKLTGVSPLQYQKNLRLQEARKLMADRNLDAGTAGIVVGYESVSQFNREYRRLFGLPPLKDIQKMKRDLILQNH